MDLTCQPPPPVGVQGLPGLLISPSCHGRVSPKGPWPVLVSHLSLLPKLWVIQKKPFHFEPLQKLDISGKLEETCSQFYRLFFWRGSDKSRGRNTFFKLIVKIKSCTRKKSSFYPTTPFQVSANPNQPTQRALENYTTMLKNVGRGFSFNHVFQACDVRFLLTGRNQ